MRLDGSTPVPSPWAPPVLSSSCPALILTAQVEGGWGWGEGWAGGVCAGAGEEEAADGGGLPECVTPRQEGGRVTWGTSRGPLSRGACISAAVQQEGGRHWGLEGGEPSWQREEEAQTGDAGGQAFKTGRTLSP